MITQAAMMAATVLPGDTLSGIAGRYCGNPADWTGTYQRNKAVIGADPDLILPGQELVLDCRQAALPQHAVSAAVASANVSTASAVPVATTGMGAFQACVIQRESGGNPYIWNSSGHWGLYQFSYSTWVAHGGAAADFGHADPDEQTRVFWDTVRQDGGSDWTPYDGCTY